MKSLTVVLITLVFCTNVWGQFENNTWTNVQQAKTEGVLFEQVDLFNYSGAIEPGMQEAVTEGTLLSLEHTSLQQIMREAPKALVIDLPVSGSNILHVELIQSGLLTDDFSVTTSSSEGTPVEYKPGLYYHGIINGNPHSYAAISFFDNSIMGVMGTATDGDMVLGNIKDDKQQRYMLYETSNFQLPPAYSCDELEVPHSGNNEPGVHPESYNPGNCVRIYYECEYDMFVENGSVAATVNYMTGIYNVVKLIYDNESINTVVSQIFVWDTPDSYATSSTSSALSSFNAGRPSYNGDVAQLVSRGAPAGGGIAWIDQICGSYGYSYAYIYNYYNQLPVYSWTVNVVTHEMGHNLGSYHTHDCKWDVNGNGTADRAIDGCGPSIGYSGTGSCPTAKLPSSGGGTIMSYCHLVSGVGIDFQNGFGPLPGNLIRDRVYNSGCLSACSSCPVAISIVKTDIGCNGSSNGSATATGSGGTSPYIYAWSNGANTASISGLSAGSYTVTVTDNNGSGCSTTSTIIINEPSPLSLAASVIPESAPGAGNGAIDLSVNNGTPSYFYNWSTGAHTQDLNNITGGTYFVTVTDQMSCSASMAIAVVSSGCTNLVSSFPYQESFETGLGFWTQQTGDDFDWTRNSGSTPTNNTGPNSADDGSYYMFTEASGNNGIARIISPCLDLTGLANVAADFSYHMYGNHIGTLSLQVSTNNGSSWTTIWSLSGDQGNSWHTASVSLDNYVTSNTKIRFEGSVLGGPRGDMAIDGIDIHATAPPCTPPSLTLSYSNASCANGSDGDASVTASGGVSPYTYSWSNGGTVASISGLNPGTYSVTVTDNTGCDANGSVTVGAPAAIQLAFSTTPESTAGANDGTVDLSISNGVSPYSFNWSNGASTEDLSGLTAGSYSITVTDANGCSKTGSVTVTQVPSCNQMVNLPYSEGFESGLGQWTQATNDDFDWTRNSGSTQTNNTGPSSAIEGSWYVYTDAGGQSGIHAGLISPCIDLTSASGPQVSFERHMYGNNIGTLDLDISTNNGTSWTNIWSLSGNQGNSWNTESVLLNAYQGAVVRLRFTGTRQGIRSDIAIDDISVIETGALEPSVMQPAGEEKTWEWVNLFPIPAKNQVTVNMIAGEDKSLPIYLIDASGKRISAGTAEVPFGQSTVTINLGYHPAGVYMIVLGEGQDQKTKTLIIQP